MEKRSGLWLLVLTLCGAFAGCGKTDGRVAQEGTGGSAATGASSDGPSSVSTGGASSTATTGGDTVTSTGGATTAGETTTTGGFGGGPWSVGAWRVNEAEGCLEDENQSFTTFDSGCDQAPTSYRDAAGQCWWASIACELEGLVRDDCGGVGDSPPECAGGGEGGAGGSMGVPCDELGCTPSEGTGLCGDMAGQVWVCYGSGTLDHQALIDAGCVDLATQVPRYCCPDTFFPECRDVP